MSILVYVAVPTYRRPDRLSALLASLQLQHMPINLDVEIAVFDNDPQRSAERITADARTASRYPLSYIHVPLAGLSAVRNAILEHVPDDCRYIAMIDDDETPCLRWLCELVRVALATGADAVIGPVGRVVPDDAPSWIKRGNFYSDMPSVADCAAITSGHSGNCLLKVDSLRKLRVRFDDCMNFAGGEDVLFFKQLVARGARIHYAAFARATEHVEAERLSARYILRRSLRKGNTLAHCDRLISANWQIVTLRALKGLARVLSGMLAFAPMTARSGAAGAVAALSRTVFGVGMLLGLSGIFVLEYKR